MFSLRKSGFVQHADFIHGNGSPQVGVKGDDWEKRHFALSRSGIS